MKSRSAFAALMMAGLLLAGILAQCSPSRQARVTATPTKTLQPTFTPTSAAAQTPIPSPTPFASQTPTPAPPTETPAVVTATVTVVVPMPTAVIPTPVPRPPTATATRRPAATRTKTPTPRPTNTPAPPFTVKIVKGEARCDYSGVTGYVTHTNKSPFPDVAVGVWSDTWDGQVAYSEASGKFEVSLTGFPVGKYYVAVVEPGTCQLPAARACQRRSNLQDFSITEKCSGPNASQVTTLSIVGP